MLHLQFMSFALALIDKSRYGSLTVSEVIECLDDFPVGIYDDLKNAVEEAKADGEITVMEVINIASSVLS